MTLAGAGVLLGALSLERQLMAQLPTGPVRARWRALGALIGGFIAGYLTFAALNWGRQASGAQMIVPATFSLDACFVWVSVSLALQTAADVRRVSRLE